MEASSFECYQTDTKNNLREKQQNETLRWVFIVIVTIVVKVIVTIVVKVIVTIVVIVIYLELFTQEYKCYYWPPFSINKFLH